MESAYPVAASVDEILPVLQEMASSRPPLFPGETFEPIVNGGVMNTRVDDEGESFALEVLYETAARLNRDNCWLQIEHDLSCHPVGRILAAGIVEKDDGHTQLHAVIGVYPSTLYRPVSSVSQLANFRWDVVREPILPHGSGLQVRINEHKLSHDDVGPLLACSDFVEPNAIYRFEKGGDDFPWLVIAEVAAGGWIAKEFLKPVLKAAGEAATAKAKALWSDLRSGLYKTLVKIGRKIGIAHEVVVNGCQVRFLTRTPRRQELEAAMKSLHESLYPSVGEFLRMQDHLIEMTFEYGLTTQKWHLVYACSTKWGVVADKPRLVDLETMTGLSPSGVRRSPPQSGREA